MTTPLTRKLAAVAISLSMHTLMIGGVAWLFGISSPRVSSHHERAACASWVALA